LRKNTFTINVYNNKNEEEISVKLMKQVKLKS
jgi:hypothetical protein